MKNENVTIKGSVFKWMIIGALVNICGSYRAAGAPNPSPGAQSEVYVTDPCTRSEKWFWPASNALLNPLTTREFEESLNSTGLNIRGFSEALALRRLARNQREIALSEYWMSRSLYSSGLIHLAEKGFNAVLDREISLTTAAYQIAALGCLSSIHKRYPGLGVPAKSVPQIAKLNALLPQLMSNSRPLKTIIWEAALYLFLDGAEQTPHVLELLKDSGPYEALALSVFHLSDDRFEDAIRDLNLFFTTSAGNETFKPFMDRARLLYGRAEYSLDRTQDAISKYQSIALRSNERVHGLSELSWAFLKEEKYREAIGTAIGLQSGAFKQTFAPESLMVMAMALNEMCRFPESMNVIQSFRRNYRDSYFWLKENVAKGKLAPTQFYRSATAFAKRLPDSKVPAPVASEWIRSSVFLSNQDRINLLFKEKELSESLSREGKSQQNTLSLKLLMQTRNLQKKFNLAKIRMKPGDDVPSELFAEIQSLKTELTRLRHLWNAAPLWRKMLANYQANVPRIQTEMVSGINQEITRLNHRMYAQLEEISENNELIEVEILNGAGEDLIWQNAHPGFKDAAKKLTKQSNQAPQEKVWNWGRTQGGLDGRSEIWEDEIGSLTADLYDNCESKDKYLAIERASFSKQ